MLELSIRTYGLLSNTLNATYKLAEMLFLTTHIAGQEIFDQFRI